MKRGGGGAIHTVYEYCLSSMCRRYQGEEAPRWQTIESWLAYYLRDLLSCHQYCGLTSGHTVSWLAVMNGCIVCCGLMQGRSKLCSSTPDFKGSCHRHLLYSGPWHIRVHMLLLHASWWRHDCKYCWISWISYVFKYCMIWVTCHM